MNDEQQRLIHQAKKFEEQQDWTNAAECWVDLSQQIDDVNITFNAAHSLYLAKRFQEAYQAILNFPDAAITAQNGLEIIQMYLAVNHYISGRMLINELPTQIQSQAQSLVEQAERSYQLQFEATIHNQLRSFYHLGDCSLPEQQQRLASADQLPLADFMIGCQFLLRDPFTNPFVRAELLNILHRLQWADEVVVLAIDDHEHKIIPATSPSAYEQGTIQTCRRIIAHQLTNDNPQLLATLNQQLDLQAILLMPITDEVITNPQKWVAVMTSLMMGSAMPGNSAREQQWQAKINQIIEKIN